MKDFEEVSCIICGTTETELIAKKGQFELPTYVSVCPRCGLVYLNPRWTKCRYDRFYSTEYDKYFRSTVFSDRSSEKCYLNIKTIWNRLDEYIPHSFKSVLDIGCGMGESLHFIAQKINGILIAGIESSDYCIDHLINKVGAELISKDVDSDWHLSNKGRFDLIIMRHSLEHFLNPISVLQKVHDVLSPDGLLYIAVPDMMSPKGSLEDYWFRTVHTYYFSRSTLIQTAARANLKSIRVNSKNSELYGIFKKGRCSLDLLSVYETQIKVINDHREKMKRRNILAYLPRKTAVLISNLVKEKIR